MWFARFHPRCWHRPYTAFKIDFIPPRATAKAGRSRGSGSQGVVCLTSALQYHESTLQMPSAVWMAIERTAWRPRTDYPRIRFVRFIGAALTEGVTHHSADALCARASALSAEHFGASRPLPSQRRYASSDLGRRSEPTGNGRSRSTFRSGKSGRPSRK